MIDIDDGIVALYLLDIWNVLVFSLEFHTIVMFFYNVG